MKLTVKEIATFGMLGAMMYASKIIMEVFPNVHLIDVFIVAMTVVYRKKALYPMYIFIFLTGLFAGFSTWWIPYLYIWLMPWAVTMILPKTIPFRWKPVVYMCVCALHGFLYGTLYAPSQAVLFGLNLEGTIAWIIAGLPFDFVHGVSNFFCGMLIVPIISVLRHADDYMNNV